MKKVHAIRLQALLLPLVGVLIASGLRGSVLPRLSLPDLMVKWVHTMEIDDQPVEHMLPMVFTENVLSDQLTSPDGLAVDPRNGNIFVSEESVHRIRMIQKTESPIIIDQRTPIYRKGYPGKVKIEPLKFPEGIDVDMRGVLYVVEDRPGGRLLAFGLQEDGAVTEGRHIDLPGKWSDIAWESVAVGKKGELVLAGSSVEQASAERGMTIFRSVILFRDPGGTWWSPLEQHFASYSAVCFSPSGNELIYTCEITGQVGWLDLQSRQQELGTSQYVAKNPEGLCALPDGSLVIAEEKGTLVHLDPFTGHHTVLYEGQRPVESVTWDAHKNRLLVTLDQSGLCIALTPNQPVTMYSGRDGEFLYFSSSVPMSVPEQCPTYLAKVLARGGLDYNKGEPEVTFREFIRRMPLVSMDARAHLIETTSSSIDPVERIQFVIFEPNTVSIDDTGVSFPLSGFVARLEPGCFVKTTLVPSGIVTRRFTWSEGFTKTSGNIAVPFPAAVSVSENGAATVHFLGLGITPDYTIVINPHYPSKSYMIVFELDGFSSLYALSHPTHQSSSSWVVGLPGPKPQQWARLADTDSWVLPESHLGIGVGKLLGEVAGGFINL